jgi:AcrR family transcriptional regulator
MNDTKTRILDAAEHLLAERGLASCSLRAITAAAGVNLGAVNYHFRTKQDLIQAVFARRLKPLNQARVAALDACEARARGKPAPLDELLGAFLAPVMSLNRDGAAFVHLLGRMYSEPSLDTHRIFAAELGDVVQRFISAFHRTLPDLPPEELFWRLFFTMAMKAHTLASGELLKLLSKGICNPSDLEDAQARLILFARAGLRASPSGPRRKKAARGRSS